MKRIIAFVIALSLIAALATVCVCAEDSPSNELGETDVVPGTTVVPGPGQPGKPEEPQESETEKEKGGCRSSVGVGAVALVAAIGAAAVLSKKEE